MWCQDEAGPYTTAPYGGQSWEAEAHPHQQSHEYLRDGTAKLLTLLHPASGQVLIKGVTSSTHAVLHSWLQTQLEAILAKASAQDMTPRAEQRAAWEVWQQGLSIRPTLPAELPPRRMLLIWDNLAGHKTPSEIIDWVEATARGWNHAPTPFMWAGKRAARRAHSGARRHAQGGSGACTHRPIRRKTTIEQWRCAS